MLREILVAFVLVSINVSIHAAGMVELFYWLTRKQPRFKKKLGWLTTYFFSSKYSR